MKWSVKEELAAQVIGYEVMKYLKQEKALETLSQGIEIKAVEVLEEIRQVLDNENLSDPVCFQHIEAIVSIFERTGIRTARHDW